MAQPWELQKEDFGELGTLVEDNNVTDIDYNGKALWVTDLIKGRYQTKIHLTSEFVEQFTHRIANYVNKSFNKANNVLEAETKTLRISIIHESVAKSGRSICIRKALPQVRLNIDTMLDTDYCDLKVLSLLINCVKARMNITFCGEPGVGKTECAKFFSCFIPPEQRVITIEDNLELHYSQINPSSDCVELQVSKELSYTDAVKLCLRQNPKWIMLSEARSTEVKYLLESWSTGVRGFTTLHLDDLRNLPDRIMNMIGKSKDADRLENDIYRYISVGILIRQRENNKGVLERYMDQVCFFDRSNEKNSVHLIVNEGIFISEQIPKEIRKTLQRAGIVNPFSCSETAGDIVLR
ncbi:MAG: ATPase, T2SS/T4P/T4SS family, partial [Lachnospiraceae bacterium]